MHAYHVEAYYFTPASADVDNTARNVRDRSGDTLTPDDQGNSSQSDTQTTSKFAGQCSPLINSPSTRVM